MGVGTGRSGYRWCTTGLLIALLALAGCGGGSESTRVYRLDTVAGSPSRSATPSALVRGRLPAGRYYTSRFEPAVRFTLPAGWRLDTETPVSFGVVREAGDVHIELSQRSHLRVPASQWFVEGLVSDGLRVARPFTGLRAALRRHPTLETTPGPVLHLLGETSTSTVVRWTAPELADPGPSSGCTEARPCPHFLVSDFTGLSWVFAPVEEDVLAEFPDHDVLALIGYDRGDAEALIAAAAVLGSMRSVT